MPFHAPIFPNITFSGGHKYFTHHPSIKGKGVTPSIAWGPPQLSYLFFYTRMKNQS